MEPYLIPKPKFNQYASWRKQVRLSFSGSVDEDLLKIPSFQENLIEITRWKRNIGGRLNIWYYCYCSNYYAIKLYYIAFKQETFQMVLAQFDWINLVTYFKSLGPPNYLNRFSCLSVTQSLSINWLLLMCNFVKCFWYPNLHLISALLSVYTKKYIFPN